MRNDTDEHHQSVVEIGKKLGFETAREVRIAPSEGGARYAPQLDVLWSLPLSSQQEAALRAVGAPVPRYKNQLPIAAWEVEGSDASTKAMQADLANMRVMGAAYGFLAVNGGTVDNLHERAVRLTRTHCGQFGSQMLVALDIAWLEELAGMALSAEKKAKVRAKVKPGGGEGEYAGSTRAKIRELGERAGFTVSESYRLPLATARSATRSSELCSLRRRQKDI